MWWSEFAISYKDDKRKFQYRSAHFGLICKTRAGFQIHFQGWFDWKPHHTLPLLRALSNSIYVDFLSLGFFFSQILSGCTIRGRSYCSRRVNEATPGLLVRTEEILIGLKEMV